MTMNERVMAKKDRYESTKKYIEGLLFESIESLETRRSIAEKISYDIYGQNMWDKESFQKIALGHLSVLTIPKEQIVAISVKIAKFV